MTFLDRPLERPSTNPRGSSDLARLGVLLQDAGLIIELGEREGASSLRVHNPKRPELSCRVVVREHPEQGASWFWYSSWNGSICPVGNLEAASRDVQGWLFQNRQVAGRGA
ncbi:hypothetical protein EDD29_6439 [Actinocorallia herbida]|uniref:Uncharacterized protein n=1 Tax=Actinocorallia herbida TaxID=58109 RepID=A0A3N1D5L1_9ACTN|nr:hypothetical protein [Actinocorallia herbida]ROO88760.1 hypothetical protein EDD29_6439 [Actinocorallia herbida]